MLIVERNVTLPSENVRKQVTSIINNFIHNNIEKKAKFNNWTLRQTKSYLSKELINNNNFFFLGTIRTKEKVTNKNISMDMFIVPNSRVKTSNGVYIHNPEEDNDTYGQILIRFNLLFEDRNLLLSTIIHEIIHGIQKFKQTSKEYDEIVKKNVHKNQLTKFLYATEQAEFEAQIGELADNIIRIFKTSKKPNTVLHVLKSILIKPKERLKNIYDWYLDIDPYMKGMFRNKLWFIDTILNPPITEDNNKNKKLKIRGDKCYKYFKQKLYTIYQKLKEKNK